MALQNMYPPQNNGIRTQITAVINAAATAITVEDASVLPAPPNVLSLGGGDDTELVKLVSVTGNILTVERGFNGTAAKSWDADTYIYRGISAQDISALQDNVNDVDEYAHGHGSEHGAAGDDPVDPDEIGAVSFIGAQTRTSEEKTLARANMEAAADDHIHGSITNDGKIGTTTNLPVFTGTGGLIGTKSPADAKIALNIATWNFGYYGRELPFTWAEIQQLIQAADFKDVRPGDYKDMTLNGSFYDAGGAATKTLSNAVFREEIAGIDSYYQYGDTSVPHHIDFISRDCLAGSLLYNATDTNSGAFVGSALFTTLNNGTNGLVKLLPADLGAVIIQKRGLTEIKTGATASSWAWNDMGKLWLPTEREIWGQDIWSEHNFGGGLAMQYPIFKDSLRHIIKGDGNGGARCAWWCASSMAGSATNFCHVNGSGDPNNTSAIGATVRVPLCFRIA